TATLMDDYSKENSLLSTEHENISIVRLGEILKRGISSGIGIFAFEKGGFIVDGGYNLKDKGSILPSSDAYYKPPQFCSKFDFPEDWNIVLAIANGDNTVTGVKEDILFAENCPVPRSEVEKLSHIIFMNLIPFLLEKNIEEFGKYINQIQDLGFKKVELGLQPPKIKNLMEKMKEFGAYGVGMSSFGPALYGITDKNTKEVYKSTKEYLGDDGIVFVSKPQNHGYEKSD
ncbi:MAG: hypothetical protein LBU40_03180, partial [Methanobrevibacter sp.]|nr:hypothetical protein [Methanobrevibacter sp.]